MTSTERIWMTPQAHIRLKTELSTLRSRPSIEVPDDFMEYDDNLVANYAARQARICQLQDLLTNAVVGEDPPDDGIAEPGMVLTVRYDDTGEIETFLLGVRGAEDAEIEVYSMQSPLGGAIAGANVPANSAPTPSPVARPARDATQGRALRDGRAEIRRATVCPTATRQYAIGDLRRPCEGTAARQPCAHRRRRVTPAALPRPLIA